MKKFSVPGLILFLIWPVMVLMSACRPKERITFAPADVHRYEVRLMQLDTARLEEELEASLPEFSLYLQGADLRSPANLLRIKYFLEDPVVRAVYAKIENLYPENELPRELGCLFERIRRLFPEFTAPQVYTYISYYDFMNRVLYLDSVLCVALDLYVDDNQKALDEAGIPRYLSRRLTPSYLLPDVSKVIGSKLIKAGDKNTLLDYIVSDGKLLTFMQKVLPDASAELILGYTPEDWLWCKAHEKEVWQYLIQENLLFDTDPMHFRYFVSEGPANPLLPGAPARLSQFIGLRIASQYLKRTGDWNTFITAAPQEILRASNYKP